MGFFDRIKKAFETPVAYPSEEFGSAVEAMESFVNRLVTERGGEGWVDFEAETATKACHFQVTGNLINLLLEEVDVPNLLRDAGLDAAANLIKSTGECLWELPGATPAELASIVDLIIRRHYGLEGEYTLRASFDG